MSLESSAEIGVFNVIWLPVFGFFGVVLSDVFVVQWVNGNLFFGAEFVVFWNNKSITGNEGLEVFAWSGDVLFVEQENAETLREAVSEVCEKVNFDQSVYLLCVKSGSQVSCCEIQFSEEMVQLSTEPR